MEDAGRAYQAVVIDYIFQKVLAVSQLCSADPKQTITRWKVIEPVFFNQKLVCIFVPRTHFALSVVNLFERDIGHARQGIHQWDKADSEFVLKVGFLTEIPISVSLLISGPQYQFLLR